MNNIDEETIVIIKEYFKGRTGQQISNTGVDKFFKQYNNIKFKIQNILDKTPEWVTLRNIICGIVEDISLNKCKICGKTLKFKYDKCKSVFKYCSSKCKNLDKELSKKIHETYKKNVFEKYGVTNTAKLEKTKNKAKTTKLLKYGDENFNNREKSKQTCVERYGVNFPLQNKEILKKLQETNLIRYGKECSLLNDDVKEKSKKTCLEKYGVEYSINSREIQEKIRNTCLEKYGECHSLNKENVKNARINSLSKNETIENRKISNLEIYGFDNYEKVHAWELIQSYKDYIIPLFEKDEYENYHKIYKWKCVRCGNEFESHIHKTMHIEEFPYLPRCWNCYPHLFGISNSEKELVEFCKQYFPNLKENNRQLIKPLELDIVIDELKLAIEFNGSFYHSVQKDFGVPLGYHLNKVLKCNSVGYRLIHIWEDEWNYNKELIKQKLIDIFTNNETIDYNQKLDRSWYNNLSGNFEEISPEIIIRDGFEVENCGYLKYTIQIFV